MRQSPDSRVSTINCALTKFTGAPSKVPSYSVVAMTQAVLPSNVTRIGARLPVTWLSNLMSAGRWFASVLGACFEPA